MEAYYGKMGQRFMEETHRRLHWVCAQVTGDRILEVGCSQGTVPILLGREGCQVQGLDLDSEAIEEANTYLAQESESVQQLVSFEVGDFMIFDRPSDCFDSIIMSEVLEHLLRPERFVERAAQMLSQSNGTLVVTVPFGINAHFDHKQTFYLLGPFQILGRFFKEVKPKLLGKWIGLVATQPRSEPIDPPVPNDDQIQALEAGFYELEQGLRSDLVAVRSEIENLGKRYRDTYDALTHANQKYRAATEDVRGLKTARDRSQADAKESARRLEGAIRQIEELKDLQAELNTRLQDERDALREAEDKRVKAEAACEALREESGKLAEEFERRNADLRKSLDENRDRTEGLSAELEKKERQARGYERDLHDASTQYQALQAEIVSLEDSLRQANEKYRKATGREIPSLKAGNQQLQQRTRELREALKQAERKRVRAEKQFLQLRSSLTFKTGALIRNQSSSLTGLLKLPVGLWRVYRQSKARARQRPKVSSEPLSAKRHRAKQNEGSGNGALHDQPRPVQAGRRLRDMSFPAQTTRVACIMDEFTFGAYQPECDLYPLTPDAWQSELEAARPELLFIESAWRGKDELWGNRVGHASDEVRGIVRWCRERGIPTIFWNKEDPIHFETFLNTARRFDYIFTTDIDCIGRYKAALGHENVYLLPFAAQPRVNNPIEKYERRDAFCFAGAYYARYPERTRDLGNFVEHLPDYRPLEIYDRNYGKTDPDYQFPEAYRPYIVGTLPFDQIDRAYKGYRYAINLNSIKQSQTMFARRVFELVASNTLTVSNYARGLRLMFGDLVVTSDEGSELIKRLESLAGNEQNLRKLRLAGLRKVMREHTYADRLAYVIAKVADRPVPNLLPSILAVGHARTGEELDQLLANFDRQTYPNCRLLIVASDESAAADFQSDDAHVEIVPVAEAQNQALSQRLAGTQWVAGLVPQDYYGPNYLTDLALATRYSDAGVIGKVAHFAWDPSNGVDEREPEAEYCPASRVNRRAALVHVDQIGDPDLTTLVAEGEVIEGAQIQAIDAFNYCRDGMVAAERLDLVQTAVDDLPGLDEGIPLDELLIRAERIPAQSDATDDGPVITGSELAEYFKPRRGKPYQLERQGQGWKARSTLADGKHDYLYAARDIEPADWGWSDHARFHLDVSPGLNMQMVLMFLDRQRKRISAAVKPANRNQMAEIPEGTAFIRPGLRFYGSGAATINGLVLGRRIRRPAEVLGRSKTLLLTNHYPSYDDLYRNGFVHSRVKAYREYCVDVDVFRLRKDEPLSWHEFENVDITTGSQQALRRMLASGRYRHVLVHFLSPDMWEVLEDFIDMIKVTVWVHGAEVQPWWRREYNYQNEEDLEEAKAESDTRLGFWKKLFSNLPRNLNFVFVSRYFANEVMLDVGVPLDAKHYKIIHNPVDTDVFSYVKKDSSQRKKVLSIRPYASRKYANDLSVKAVLELSKESFFDDLEFYFVGDGVLFDEVLDPLKEFGNVYISQGFLPQDRIAELHKHYGVFLCPTRMDAQGVSKDEAMSSGLVVLSNAITAIPEFIDDKTGLLVPSEDFIGMADALKRVYKDPELFCSLSEAASVRARSQTGKNTVISKELELFLD
jgi:glycosyltransferase involved in cell wall biosynthesis/spore maturation protein CgeB/predicted  nucleic acid-binding Zn-ribbon protein